VIPYLVLAAGVLIVSTSSILIRYAQQAGMPSISIAAWRLVMAALILTPIAWARVGGELRSLHRRDMLFGLASGALLAVHLAAWINSLAYTSVASSTVLVTTNPVWVGLASWLIFRERPGRGTVSGIVLTITGSIVILVSGAIEGATETYSNPLLGNMLALAGAFTVSGYFLIGRGLRRRLSTLAYIWLVYTSAAVTLVLWMLLSGGQWFGFTLLAYLLVLALAIGPQLLGHTAFNWALAHLSATFIALAILGEPVSSALLALVLFQEMFSLLQLAGFVLLLVGIYVASTDERRTLPATTEHEHTLEPISDNEPPRTVEPQPRPETPEA
jgi:drug/metabolite transporter (DMT)-like permease